MIAIGDYTITKELGKGPFGAVYSAEHRFLKTPCVIKVFPAELSEDPDFINRFQTEVHLLAQLEHPHIVKIHNISRDAENFYFASDSIVDLCGQPLDLTRFLANKEGHISEEEIFDLTSQIVDALAYLHSIPYGKRCRCHLGLKPANVMIDISSGKPLIKLADAGMMQLLGPAFVLTRGYLALAENLGGGNIFNSAPQLHKRFMMAYEFLSPELRSSDSAALVDERADIYSLGVLMYYMLMHNLPQGYFPPPSQLKTSLQRNWDKAIRESMHPDPTLRLKSVRDVLLILNNGAAQASTHKPQSLKPIIKPQELIRPTFEADPGAIFQTETTVARYVPKHVEQKQIDPIPTEMIVIPEGTYYRGSNNGGRDEMPRHAIRLESFAIDIHPVTNDQFVCFLEAMGGEKDGNNNDIIRLRDSRIKRAGGKLLIESGYTRHPVVGVTWYGAVAYAKWVGKRLPTEAEWEVAATGGSEDYVFPTGLSIERSQANYFSSDTTSVMSYPPQGFGLYDMAGNVYEWCHDWYEYHYYDTSVQEPDNPKGPHQGVYRILKGGCWKSLKEDLRCAHRHRNNPGTMTGTYGFRCAADVS